MSVPVGGMGLISVGFCCVTSDCELYARTIVTSREGQTNSLLDWLEVGLSSLRFVSFDALVGRGS